MNEPFPTISELLFRLEEGETSTLEVKASSQRLSKDVWETISAFANTSGGFIVLGIAEDDQGVFSRVGVKAATNQVTAFFNQLNNRQKFSQSVCKDHDVAIVNEAGLDFILIRVPMARRREQPVFVGRDPFLGTYKRNHDGDYKCSEEEVRIMMREGAEQAADAVILEHYTLDDLDLSALKAYRQRYIVINPESPFNDGDNQSFLSDLGCYAVDRSSGKSGLTLAGLLLFGKQRAIKERRGRHLIDFRFRQNPDQERWDNRITWESHLFGAYLAISQELLRGLPIPFSVDAEGTRASTTPEREALREAFVNLLVHADYQEQDASVILREPDGYTFHNPGSSRVRDFSRPSAKLSDPRNPTILAAFRYIGWADEAGTGIKKIRRAWKSLGLAAPFIDTGTNEYHFELYLRHTHLLSEIERRWLAGFRDVEVSELQQMAMIEALRSGQVDNATLCRLTGCHPADATKALRHLKDVDLLAKKGDKRGTWYHLADMPLSVHKTVVQQEAIPFETEGRSRITESQPVITESTGLIMDSEGQIIESPPQIIETEGQIIESPPQIIESLAENAASIRKLLEELGVELDEKGQIVKHLDDPLKELVMRLINVGGKASRSEMEQLILLLCTRTPYTAEEIAQRTGRTVNYLQQGYLAPLVKRKKLERLKQTKAHPKFRYTTALKNTND